MGMSDTQSMDERGALEFAALTAKEHQAVKDVIETAKREPGRHTINVMDSDGAEIGKAYSYSYTIAGKDIAWGFNRAPSFQNVARGIISA
jgi:hypothetical protein